MLSLPIPISNNLVEYPVCISIDLTRWVVSDGNGLLYIIIIDKTSQEWQGKVQNTFELIEAESTGLPFRLHSVTLLESGDISALISTTRKEPSSFNNKSSTIFDYRSVIFSTSSFLTAIQPLDLQWKL